MKRLPVVLLAVSVVAVVACSSQEKASSNAEAMSSAQATTERSPINVHVSCRDTAPGIGVKIHPWRVRANRGETLAWNLVPARDSMPTTLSPVVDSLWPFDSASYTWYRRTQSIPVKADADTITYRYRLTIVCPTATIVIDPEIIVN